MTQVASKAMANPADAADGPMFVTMYIDSQMFGIEVRHVRDVLRAQTVTPIPLAPPEVAGSLNLRGRIVTVIDLRKRLKLPPGAEGAASNFVVVELKGELYSLMVDGVGEVLTSTQSKIGHVPPNISLHWKDIATGIYKLDNELLVLVDVQSLINV